MLFTHKEPEEGSGLTCTTCYNRQMWGVVVKSSENGWGFYKEHVDCITLPHLAVIEKEQSEKKKAFLEMKSTGAKINNWIPQSEDKA